MSKNLPKSIKPIDQGGVGHEKRPKEAQKAVDDVGIGI